MKAPKPKMVSGSAARPITYRDLHEEAAGMGLCDEFFKASNINPHALVRFRRELARNTLTQTIRYLWLLWRNRN